ncbi:unnamed protein product, partial [Amoebophrya sp. A25]|eukprot:GSA25T00021380001.1
MLARLLGRVEGGQECHLGPPTTSTTTTSSATLRVVRNALCIVGPDRDYGGVLVPHLWRNLVYPNIGRRGQTEYHMDIFIQTERSMSYSSNEVPEITGSHTKMKNTDEDDHERDSNPYNRDELQDEEDSDDARSLRLKSPAASQEDYVIEARQ